MNRETPAPDLGFTRVLLVVTGSSTAADVPFWLSWLSEAHPALEVQVAVTRSAERFVTRSALAARTRGRVVPDAWPEDDGGAALHVELADWAEAVIVCPATLHFTARLALGLGDSPVLLAAQCTAAPVAVVPALPPGGLDCAAYQAHWAALSTRRNVLMVPPRPGVSATTGRRDAWVPAFMPDVVERLRAWSAANPPQHSGPGGAAAFLAGMSGPP